ncbi:MAG: hypothetical protein DCF12_02810 [Snowella sp.]|jgi:hypothetical protein|nr:MAG: hypothetical protein DCF12_02810 [Snowella sp.]
MLFLTSQEIAQYRSQLALFPDALLALDCIEDCEGNIEDAALTLAIQVGQQPDRTDWLDGLAKRCRVEICRSEFRDELLTGNIATAVECLIETKICPKVLVTPVILYALKSGIESFCEPLTFKLG